MSGVGIIANPLAGKDVRRLVSHAAHTPDAAKVAMIRRAVVAATEAGARRIVLSDDVNRLCARAVERLDLSAQVVVEFAEQPGTRSRLDTVATAREMCAAEVGAVVVLGGDGTCRDVAIGWPDVPMIAVSTGTNNVFPRPVETTTAGFAAGLVATGAVDFDRVARRAKRLTVRIGGAQADVEDLALVEVAVIDTTFTGARAVTDPSAVRSVVAAIAGPGSTGLSAIAGRVEPIDRDASGAVVVDVGGGGRTVRVPLSPGRFDDVPVASARRLGDGASVCVSGPCVLAFDGERQRVVAAGDIAEITVDACGPYEIDVDLALALAVERRLFDVPKEGIHGD